MTLDDAQEQVGRPAPSCTHHDGDTGLRCMREKGHEPPHRCEIEWEDDDDDT